MLFNINNYIVIYLYTYILLLWTEKRLIIVIVRYEDGKRDYLAPEINEKLYVPNKYGVLIL